MTIQVLEDVRYGRAQKDRSGELRTTETVLRPVLVDDLLEIESLRELVVIGEDGKEVAWAKDIVQGVKARGFERDVTIDSLERGMKKLGVE